jgi:hypothetical protein
MMSSALPCSKLFRPAAALFAIAFVPGMSMCQTKDTADPKKTPPAKMDDVLAIFAEIDLPPLKPAGEALDYRKLTEDNPFPAGALKAYGIVGPSFDEIQKDPQKFARNFPIRAAVVDAVILLRKPAPALPFEIRSPINDGLKRTIEKQYQRTVAAIQGDLEEMDARLTRVGLKKKRDKPDRWLAHYDYVSAEVKLRIAWCNEYNLCLAKARTEPLTELDPKLNQNCWRLVAGAKMQSLKDIRDLADEAKQALADLEKSYPDTPWALLGAKQKDIQVGLHWQPAVIVAKKKK